MILNQFHTVCPKIETEFLGKLRNSNVFPAQNQVVSKKKKKKVFTEIETNFSATFGNSIVSGGLFSYAGGYFQFFTKNRPQKHQKRVILHTSQANGGARAPPPPLATLLLTGTFSCDYPALKSQSGTRPPRFPYNLTTDLNVELHHLYLWCCVNKLSVNPTKTNIVLFHLNKRKRHAPI